jgi:DNA ligase-4
MSLILPSGAYYGSGHRGGGLSSFLCGLKVSQNYRDTHPGTHPEKCDSFFKVGGGFRAEDYARIKHLTNDKWHDWDRNNPPDEYIILGGQGRQFERPDMWIKPSDSIVIEAKAASIALSDQFATGFTLRFPRFKRVREDKDWTSSLSHDEFMVLKKQAEEQPKEDTFEVEGRRRLTKRLKKELVIAGSDQKVKTPYAGPKTQIFEGLNFCVLSDMQKPQKKTKSEIEQMIKANGGSIFQNSSVKEDMICIGEKRVVKVASLIKGGQTNIVKPLWILDAIKQDFLVPFEPNHMFHITDTSRPSIEENVDIYGDSYTRDCTAEELRSFFDEMIIPKNSTFKPNQFIKELQERNNEDSIGDPTGSLFRNCLVRFVDDFEDVDLKIARYQFRFAGGVVAEQDDDEGLTHFVITDKSKAQASSLRKKIAGLNRKRLPRVVSVQWLMDSWKERTLLDEERYGDF